MPGFSRVEGLGPEATEEPQQSVSLFQANNELIMFSFAYIVRNCDLSQKFGLSFWNVSQKLRAPKTVNVVLVVHKRLSRPK